VRVLGCQAYGGVVLHILAASSMGGRKGCLHTDEGKVANAFDGREGNGNALCTNTESFLIVCEQSCQVELHQPVRLAYQPPANSTFLSRQTSHQ
jgi:hypothetical protein